MQRLGKQIKLLRQRLGMSQGKLAELAQLRRCDVVNIERGREALSLDTLMRIAASLNAEPCEMLLTGQCDNAADTPWAQQIH
jgi:transcriptional regulator with XRE-family HTH domain